MAVIKIDGGYNALPISYKRGNPIPLDKSSVWYDYNLMAAYAATDPVAYVGQILGLVDEINETATAYIILNTAGDLQQVGTATLTDDATITLSDDGVLSLKDFGVKFYKYIPEITDEETGVKTPAHYIEQNVDENNPWSAGLEPRVVSKDNKWVIGWYEPNPTTIEGVNDQVSAIQSTVNDLINEVTELNTAVGVPANTETNTSASGIFAELDKKANINDVYDKGQVDNAIANAVANIDHLKRVKVESIDDIDTTKENYIFMVPTGLQYEDDKYDEYMVIDGVIEKVGAWEVTLDGYITQEQLTNSLTNYVTNNKLNDSLALIETNLANYATKDDLTQGLADKVTNDALTIKLADYATTTNVETAINNAIADKVSTGEFETALAGKISITEGYGLISDAALAKLNNIPEGANENVIETVADTDFNLVAKHLSLKSIDASKVIITEEGSSIGLLDKLTTLNNSLSNLSGQIDNNTANISINLEKINTNTTNIETLTSSLGAINENIGNIEKDLANYVKVSVYESKIAELENRLLWHELEI